MSADDRRPDDRRLEVWRDFLRSHAAVIEVLARDLVDDQDMALPWYDVLLHLNEAGGAMRMQELARSVLISKSGLTRLIDRMEAAGFVERRPCPNDRRGTEAVLTASGKDALRAAAPVHLRGVAEHFTELLSDDELDAVESFLARVAELHGRVEPDCS